MGEAPRDGTSPIEVRDSGELPATGEAAGADFADAEGAAFVTRVDLSQLLRPAAFKAAVGLIAGMVAIAWPRRRWQRLPGSSFSASPPSSSTFSR